MQNIAWFHQLNKPFFMPPDWLFRPMWILIYIIIAVAFILYIGDGKLKDKQIGIALFTLQMLLNLLWSPIFFNYQNIELAMFVTLALWYFILLTIVIFYKHSKMAAYLLVPYMIWVSFAAYLNIGYFMLN